VSRPSDVAQAAVAAALIVLGAAACREPTQYGGPIPIDEAGMHARMHALCRAGMAGHAGAKCEGARAGDGSKE
jgi:hypothetical protein